MPRFSIIVPCFNAEAFLPAALETVTNQTERDWEFICVDDGSGDGTFPMLLSAALKDTRIRVIRQRNQGPGAARNRGAAAARGEILVFLDADDLWVPGKLASLGGAFDGADRPDLVFSQVAFFRDNPGAPSAFSTVPAGQLTVRNFIGENPTCTMSNVAITAETFRRVGGFDTDMHHSEDLAWLIRVAASGAAINGIPEMLTFYRANEQGLSADLEAMHRGWRRAAAQVTALDPSVSPADIRAAEAVHLRYLARRALRTGAPATTALNLICRALAKSPAGYFNDPRRSLAIAAGSLAALFMPASTRRMAFGN